jgi:hypothetical protein
MVEAIEAHILVMPVAVVHIVGPIVHGNVPDRTDHCDHRTRRGRQARRNTGKTERGAHCN